MELIHVVSHQGKTRALCPEVTRTPGQVSIRYWHGWHSIGVPGARRRGRLRAIPAGQNFENKIFIVTFFFP